MLWILAAPWARAAAIPSGSHATVRLNTSLSSATAHTGEVWSGTLTHEIVEHGKVVVRVGAPVKGKVTYVNRSGRLHKPGALTLRLTSINGETVYSSRVTREGKSHTKEQCHQDRRRSRRRSADWRGSRRRQRSCHRRSSGSGRGNGSCCRYRQAGSQDSGGERADLCHYRIEVAWNLSDARIPSFSHSQRKRWDWDNSVNESRADELPLTLGATKARSIC